MNKDENDIVGFMDELIDGDESLQKFEKEWGALSSFLVDYEYLKEKNNLTQKDIAQACGTTQSAISRLERMRGKPAYTLLNRISKAVGGKLYISPVADVSVTLPLDLQDKARQIAEKKGVSTQDLLHTLLRDGIKNIEYSNAFGDGDCSHVIKLKNINLQPGEYKVNEPTKGIIPTSDYPYDLLLETAV